MDRRNGEIKGNFMVKAVGITSGETAACWYEDNEMKAYEMYAEYIKDYSRSFYPTVTVSISRRRESNGYIFYDVERACIC